MIVNKSAANIIRPAYMDCWWDGSRLKFLFCTSYNIPSFTHSHSFPRRLTFYVVFLL